MYGSTDKYNVLTKISPSLHCGISILSRAKLDSVGTLSTPGRLRKTILAQVSDADSVAILILLESKGMGREQSPGPRPFDRKVLGRSVQDCGDGGDPVLF